MEQQETPLPSRDLKQQVLIEMKQVPVSTPDTTRYLRGTNNEEAEEVCRRGYGMERRSGFSGNAIGLPREEDRVLYEMENTHRGASTVLLFAFPNVKSEIVKAQNEELLPRPFYTETLFPIEMTDPTTVPTSGVNRNADMVFDLQFIEGYYDKSTNKWHPNPLYWEHALQKQAQRENWSQDELKKRREDTHASLRAKALQRLEQEEERHKKQKEKQITSLQELLDDLSKQSSPPKYRIP